MSDIVAAAQRIFADLATKSEDRALQFDPENYKKLINIFHVGDYYYYVFNLQRAEFDMVSPEVEQVLGYPASTMNIPTFLNGIHPEDAPWFLNFENKVMQFFTSLRADQILKYKVRYDYRVRKANGEYIRILQQVITMQYDETDLKLLRTFGVHTDITYLKKDGRPVLSFIGLEGEPSYIDVDVDKVFTASRPVISKREKEILILLIEGKNTQAIADALFISPRTVETHRKNMIRKTNASSTPELVGLAIRNGWV